MGARKRKAIQCNHGDTETEIILHEERKIDKGKYVIPRRATLKEFCPECEQEFEYVVMGGVLIDVGYDSP